MSLERRTFTDQEIDDAAEWIRLGVEKGWISEPFCYTHDGDPYMTEEEEQQWEEGFDPCSPVLKLLI
jgi:hypothetical protein